MFLDRGLATPAQVLNFSVFLGSETAFTVWTVATPTLLSLYNRVKYQFSDPDALTALTGYMTQLMTAVARQVSFTARNSISDEVLETLLAPTVARFDLGRRAELYAIYQRVALGALRVTDLPPNLVDLVLQVGVSADKGNVFDSFVYQQLYRAKVNTTGGQDPNDPYATLGYPALLAAIASTRDATALTQIFERAADPQYFRPEHAGTIIRLAAANDLGLPLLNPFLNSTRWFGLWNGTLSQGEWGQTLQVALGLHTWPTIIDGLEAFMATQPVTPYIRQRIDVGLATARGNAQWIQQHWPDMATFLKSRSWVRPSAQLDGEEGADLA